MRPAHSPALAARWADLTLPARMANVGSEVERALRERDRGRPEAARAALERALELFDLTLGSVRGLPRRREVARARDEFVACMLGASEYAPDPAAIRRYYLQFALAARR